MALVGESGSGKSVTAMSILNLLPDNAERSGTIRFQGRDLLGMDLMPSCRRCAASDIACVFQDPMSSLNPVFTVGQQVAEPLRQAPRDVGAPGARAAPRRCWSRWACPNRGAGSTRTRTSSRAASSSG